MHSKIVSFSSFTFMIYSMFIDGIQCIIFALSFAVVQSLYALCIDRRSYTFICTIFYFSLVSPKKYCSKNFELCQTRNVFFTTALTVPKLKFCRLYCSFGTVNAVQNNKIICSQSSKFFAKYFYGLPKSIIFN